jgi:hypothetical protein
MKNLGGNIVGSSTSRVQQPILLQDKKKYMQTTVRRNSRAGRKKTEFSMTLIYIKLNKRSGSIYVPALALTARSDQNLTP